MHNSEADYPCPVCHWTIRAGITHECNYMICHNCKGEGQTGWRQRETCPDCGGDGKWHDKPEEDEGDKVPA